MALKKVPLSEKLDRVQKSIQQFPSVASSLNVATDQLRNSIAHLEAVLKKFSLGIPTWVSFNDSASADGLTYYHEDLGYAKLGGKWGIAVRTVQGDERSDHENVDQWPFPEAPRHLRVEATEVIPELLEALLRAAGEMSRRMADRAEEVETLAAGIGSILGLQENFANLAAGESITSQLPRHVELAGETLSSQLARSLLSSAVPANLAGSSKVTSGSKPRK